MALKLNPSPFDGSLRSYVVGAATSVVSRLSLLQAAATSEHRTGTGASAAVVSLLDQSIEYVEQTLHELVAIFPEPEVDLQGNVRVAAPDASRSDAAVESKALDDVGVKGNANVLSAPSILLDERDKLEEMQRSMDPNTLKRCIALLKLNAVEAQVEVEQYRAEREALVASHRRRCEGFNITKQELTKEILNLRRSALHQEPAVMEGMFLTLDVLFLLCGGSATNAGLTDAQLRERMVEVCKIFEKDVDAQRSVSEERFQLSLDRISELQRLRDDAEARVERIGQRMVDNEDRARRDMTSMERRQRELKHRIVELEQKLSTDKAAWIALERELETVKGDKDALIQAVGLAEAKTKQQRHDLYVHIATLSQQLLVEQKKYSMSYEADPDPLNVDLVMQVASSGLASDLTNETLERMLAATQRPDDPSKLVAQENLADHCEQIRKDVRAWKSVALESGLQLQMKSVEKADLEEDLLRVIGFSKDNNLPVPMDLIKSRVEAEHINAFDDNTNFKEICRTLRTDSKVASKRLFEIRLRMQTIVPLAQRTAKGDALSHLDAREQEKSREVALNAAQYARGPGSAAAAAAARSQPNDPPDEVGTLLEEVERTERVEASMRQTLLDNAKQIRQLSVDKQAAERAKVQERVSWVDQWVKLLEQLPPTVTEQLNLAGLDALEASPIILDEFKRIKQTHQDEVEQEKKEMLDQVEKEREKLVTLAKEVQEAKTEFLQERKAAIAAAANPSSFRRKPSFPGGRPAGSGDGSPSDTTNADAMGGAMFGKLSFEDDASSVASGVWKKPVECDDAEQQTEPPPEVADQETTTVDAILYNRQFRSKDMETVRVRMLERGAQASPIPGTDVEAQCDLAPKFDHEAADELFQELGHLFQAPMPDPSLEARVSPPRCGSPSFPKRMLCPSCGESIAHVAGVVHPNAASQTDAPRRKSSLPMATMPSSPVVSRRASAMAPSIPPPPPPAVYHVYEALFPETLSMEEREFVGLQVRRLCERANGVVLSAVSSDEAGCAQLAAFRDPVDAVRCATSLHEFQREILGEGSTSASQSTSQTPRIDGPLTTPTAGASVESTRRRHLIHSWPRCRNGLAMTAAGSVALCALAFAGETVSSLEEPLTTALASTQLHGQYSSVKRLAKPPTAAGDDDETRVELWSVVSMLHAERRDDWKALPHTRPGYDLGRASLLNDASLPVVHWGAQPNTAPMAPQHDEDDDDGAYSLDSAGGMVDGSTQSDPVVVLNDDEFAALRANGQQGASGSRATTPLGSQRLSASALAQRPKPSSASATALRRPSTAGVKHLSQSLGVSTRNDAYVDALLQLWRAIAPFVPDDQKTAPHRAFSADEMPLVPLLFEVAALVNVRGLIGFKESETEQHLKVHCITGLQAIFQDLQLADFTLPTRIPYTVAVRTPGTDTLASSAPPLLFSTSISDAFRPILHLLSRAVSVPISGDGKGKVGVLSVSSRPPTPPENAGHPFAATDEGGRGKAHDVRTIHAKLMELEGLVKDALDDLKAAPPTCQPSSPPPLLSAYLGWETVPLSKPPSPLQPDGGHPDGEVRGVHGCRQWKTQDAEITVYDGDQPPFHGRVGRVVVRSSHPSVSIRKGAVMEGLVPQISAAGHPQHPQSSTGARCATRELGGGAKTLDRLGKQLLKPIPTRRPMYDGYDGCLSASAPALPTFPAPSTMVSPERHRGATHTPPPSHAPYHSHAQGHNSRSLDGRLLGAGATGTHPRRGDSPMHRTLRNLPTQLPPVAAIADAFARTYGETDILPRIHHNTTTIE